MLKDFELLCEAPVPSALQDVSYMLLNAVSETIMQAFASPSASVYTVRLFLLMQKIPYLMFASLQHQGGTDFPQGCLLL